MEMIHAGIEIRAVSQLPLILDGACGWGDPMHMHRTIAMAETAGFAAIELEDQILPQACPSPRRDRAPGAAGAHGSEARGMRRRAQGPGAPDHRPDQCRARGGAGSGAAPGRGLSECRGRCSFALWAEAPRGGPRDRRASRAALLLLMYMPSGEGLWSGCFTAAELRGLGYRLLVDPNTPLLAAYSGR